MQLYVAHVTTQFGWRLKFGWRIWLATNRLGRNSVAREFRLGNFGWPRIGWPEFGHFGGPEITSSGGALLIDILFGCTCHFRKYFFCRIFFFAKYFFSQNIFFRKYFFYFFLQNIFFCSFEIFFLQNIFFIFKFILKIIFILFFL